MTIEKIALINEEGQVVNYVLVDVDDTETITGLHEVHNTTRYVVANDEVIILDDSPEIWTTHCDNPDCKNHGFNLPTVETPVAQIPKQSTNPDDYDHDIVVINGRVYPADSWLIKENAANRPDGWVLPDGQVEVSLPK